MSSQMSQADPAAMTTEDLMAEIDGFNGLAVAVAARMSVILVELRKRKVSSAFFRHPVLCFFQSIADQTLSAEAAIILGNSELIKAVLPLDPQRQLEIAYGAKIPVAVLTDDGKIKSDDLHIRMMDRETLVRAFGPAGIRSVAEQADMIRASGRVERIGMITVLRDEQVLKIGNQKVRPEDLRGPLAALGYSLDLARNVAAKKDHVPIS